MNKQVSKYPNDINYIIYNFYLDIHIFNFFKKKLKIVHQELKKSTPTLNISEDIFDWFLDFSYAIRLPELISV